MLKIFVHFIYSPNRVGDKVLKNIYYLVHNISKVVCFKIVRKSSSFTYIYTYAWKNKLAKFKNKKMINNM